MPHDQEKDRLHFEQYTLYIPVQVSSESQDTVCHIPMQPEAQKQHDRNKYRSALHIDRQIYFSFHNQPCTKNYTIDCLCSKRFGHVFCTIQQMSYKYWISLSIPPPKRSIPLQLYV